MEVLQSDTQQADQLSAARGGFIILYHHPLLLDMLDRIRGEHLPGSHHRHQELCYSLVFAGFQLFDTV